jgi:hypothetical protein
MLELEKMEQEAGLNGQDTEEKTMFMSESVYGKISSPHARRRRALSD